MSERGLDEVNPYTCPRIAQEFLNRGVKNVVITLGGKGAYYATATDCGRAPAYKVKVVASTGAGAYASKYLRQKAAGTWNTKSAIIRASKAAALTVGKLGAQEGIPWADEIDQSEAELNVVKTREFNIDEETRREIETMEAGSKEILLSVE